MEKYYPVIIEKKTDERTFPACHFLTDAIIRMFVASLETRPGIDKQPEHYLGWNVFYILIKLIEY